MHHVLPILVALALAAPIDVPALPTPVAAGTAFVRSLVADDLSALRSIGVSGWSDPGGAVDLIEKYDCISIAHHEISVERMTAEEATLSLFVDGTAFTNGAIRREMRLPGKWRIELMAKDGDWRIKSAATDEMQIAFELREASAADRACIVESHRDLDLQQLTRNLIAIAVRPSDTGAVEFSTRLAESFADPITEQYVLRMASLHVVQNGDGRRAMTMATDAVTAARHLGDPDEIAAALFRLGIVAWLAGRDEDATSRLKESATYVGSVAEPRIALRALYMYAFITARQGRLRESFDAGEQLEKLSTTWDWEEGALVATLHKGTIHANLGDEAGARRYHLEAFDRASRSNNTSIASYGLFNATTILPEEVSNEHVVLIRRAMSLLNPPQAPSLRAMQAGLVITLTLLDRMEEAEEVLRSGIAGFPTSFEAHYPRSVLRLKQGRYEEALAGAREGERLQASRRGGNEGRESPWVWHDLAGKALRGLHRNSEAAAAFETAIALIEERRAEMTAEAGTRAQFLEDKLDPYHELMEIHLAEGRVREALLLSERVRARTLQELLAQGGVDLTTAMSNEEKAEETRLENEVVDLNRGMIEVIRTGGDSTELRARLTAAHSMLSVFRTQLYLKHPEILLRRGDVVPVALDRVETILPREDGAILVYAVHARDTHVFVLTRREHVLSVTVKTIPVGRKELADRISNFIRSLERRDLDYAGEAHALYELLIEPVGGEMAGRRLICVVPDGAVWHLPFQVLRSSSGEHLVERVATFFAPSLSVLQRGSTASRSSSAPRLLAMGNATFGSNRPAFYRGDDLDALPDAEREVREIGALYGRVSRVLVRAEARESDAKALAGTVDVLHFATHAVIDDASPLYSSLVLAGSKSEDGLLEAREILDLHLQAEVAVLSACETARGSVRAGEGMVGMSWALMAAGCPSSVVSEWRVASSSTSALMVEFHRQLLRLRGSRGAKADALRRAQLTLFRGRYRHPFYWSAFVLVSSEW